MPAQACRWERPGARRGARRPPKEATRVAPTHPAAIGGTTHGQTDRAVDGRRRRQRSALLLGACSASVSFGANAVPKAQVETRVAAALAAEVHQPVPKVACPDDLGARTGTVMQCTLTPQGSPNVHDPVCITVTSVHDGTAHFDSNVLDPGETCPRSKS